MVLKLNVEMNQATEALNSTGDGHAIVMGRQESGFGEDAPPAVEMNAKEPTPEGGNSCCVATGHVNGKTR